MYAHSYSGIIEWLLIQILNVRSAEKDTFKNYMLLQRQRLEAR